MKTRNLFFILCSLAISGNVFSAKTMAEIDSGIKEVQNKVNALMPSVERVRNQLHNKKNELKNVKKSLEREKSNRDGERSRVNGILSSEFDRLGIARYLRGHGRPTLNSGPFGGTKYDCERMWRYYNGRIDSNRLPRSSRSDQPLKGRATSLITLLTLKCNEVHGRANSLQDTVSRLKGEKSRIESRITSIKADLEKLEHDLTKFALETSKLQREKDELLLRGEMFSMGISTLESYILLKEKIKTFYGQTENVRKYLSFLPSEGISMFLNDLKNEWAVFLEGLSEEALKEEVLLIIDSIDNEILLLDEKEELLPGDFTAIFKSMDQLGKEIPKTLSNGFMETFLKLKEGISGMDNADLESEIDKLKKKFELI